MPTVIDLFCGGGGFSCGFEQMGFSTTLTVDNDYYACQTYAHNFPNTSVLRRDIRELHSLEILEITAAPDVVLASPPCESFSRANPKRKKNPLDRVFDEDSSGNLLLHAIRLIGDLAPKFFIIENVTPAIEGKLGGLIQDQFSLAGYDEVFFNIIDAEWHGVPSIRRRVFISNVQFDLKPSNSIKTVEEAFIDLPPPEKPHELVNHYEIAISWRYEKKLPTLTWGKGLVSFGGAGGKSYWNWTRLDPTKPSPTVMGLSQFIHPYEDRACTVREHARLMGFSDQHIFLGRTRNQYNQVGEAVPPPIAYKLAKILKELI